jgi:hypothetical protein
MRFIQTTVYGWPDKAEGREPTRIVGPLSCSLSKLYASGIANRLGGLFRVDIALVEDAPNRDELEITRVAEILEAARTGDQ